MKTILASLLPLAVLALIRLTTTANIFDDAYITLKVALNTATGHAFEFNPGERIFVTTSPLWTMAIAAARGLTGDVVVAVRWLGIVCEVLLVVSIVRLSGRLCSGHIVGALAAVLLVTNPVFVLTSLSGMELPFYLLAIVLAADLVVRGSYRAALVIASLALWIRFDGPGAVRIHRGDRVAEDVGGRSKPESGTARVGAVGRDRCRVSPLRVAGLRFRDPDECAPQGGGFDRAVFERLAHRCRDPGDGAAESPARSQHLLVHRGFALLSDDPAVCGRCIADAPATRGRDCSPARVRGRLRRCAGCQRQQLRAALSVVLRAGVAGVQPRVSQRCHLVDRLVDRARPRSEVAGEDPECGSGRACDPLDIGAVARCDRRGRAPLDRVGAAGPQRTRSRVCGSRAAMPDRYRWYEFRSLNIGVRSDLVAELQPKLSELPTLHGSIDIDREPRWPLASH